MAKTIIFRTKWEKVLSLNWRDKLIYKAPSNPDSKAVFGWLGIKAVFADPAGEVEKGSYGFHFAMWLFGIYACK